MGSSLRLLSPIVFAFAVAIFSPLAAAQSEAVSCREIAGFQKLDFWIGSWDVFDAKSGKKAGENVIESVLKGCAVYENWTGIGGGQGKSWFYFVAATGAWKQVWVTEAAAQTGGLKEKLLIEEFENGGVRFRGEIKLEDAGSYLDQTTLTPLPDGRVRQVIEVSRDGGETWQTTFDAYYVRKRQDRNPEAK